MDAAEITAEAAEAEIALAVPSDAGVELVVRQRPVDVFQRQFCNAILVPGLKHITDNCLQDTLKHMTMCFVWAARAPSCFRFLRVCAGLLVGGW